MAIVNAHYGFCAKGGALNFTYTGEYNQREDGVVELLTSGTLVFLDPAVIDIFCVGGGGAGTTPTSSGVNEQGYGGGGGGYTATKKRQRVDGTYAVTIGAGGGFINEQGLIDRQGAATHFGDILKANGGLSGGQSEVYNGSDGGSGGGGGVNSNSNYGAGGSDGNNGETGFPASQIGGKGQGLTTREFGEPNGKLYAGGGGGGRYLYTTTAVISPGGNGGGGSGAWCSDLSEYPTRKQAATAGIANTGGGGGGGVKRSYRYMLSGANGGSGIVCFRAAK